MGSFKQKIVFPLQILIEEDLLSTFKCSFGEHILIRPMQLPCGHRICFNCVEESNPMRCLVCLDDAPYFTKDALDSLFLDKGFLHENGKVLMQCSFPQCEDKIPYSELEKHYMQCPFAPQVCSLCNETVIARDMDGHTQNQCPYRFLICEACNKSVEAFKLENHRKSICPVLSTVCPYCEERFCKHDLDHHEVNDCPISWHISRGCPFQCAPPSEGWSTVSLQEHRRNSVELHINKLIVELYEFGFEQKNDFLHAFLKSIYDVEELHDRNLCVDEKDPNYYTVLEKIVSDKESLAKLLNFHVKGLEMLFSLPQRVQNAWKNCELVVKSLVAAQHELERKNQQILHLERILLNAHEPMYAGTLIWRINNIQEIIFNCQNNHQQSYASQMFHTGKYGYCMRLILFPCSDISPQYMSLYLVIYSGPYDSLLKWPFEQSVIFAVERQYSKKPNPHVVQMKLTIQRPNTCLEKSYNGSKNFISHHLLLNKSNNFVKDDTLFIRCTVDCSDLLHN